MKKFLKEWWGIITFFLIFAFLRFYAFPWVNVDGASMDPTLQNKENIVTSRFAKIERFDIVVANIEDNGEEKKIIKRVIGMPGDTIRYDNDQLYINGKKTAEPYLDKYKKLWKKDRLQKTYAKLPNGAFFQKLAREGDAFTVITATKEADFTIKVPKGEYLLLGDNRPLSKDGREEGPVKASQIQGEAKLIIWPLKEFGWVKDKG